MIYDTQSSYWYRCRLSDGVNDWYAGVRVASAFDPNPFGGTPTSISINPTFINSYDYRNADPDNTGYAFMFQLEGTTDPDIPNYCAVDGLDSTVWSYQAGAHEILIRNGNPFPDYFTSTWLYVSLGAPFITNSDADGM